MRRPRAAVLAGVLLSVFVIGALPACADDSAPASTVVSAAAPLAAAPVKGFVLVASYPRDPNCFVEGLQWTGSGFYESCGLYGSSSIRQTTLAGAVKRQTALPKTAFGEGLVRLGTSIYQMTWKEGIVFVRDATTLKVLSTRPMPTGVREGWGMTTDGRSLIVSDGTPTVRWVDPKTFAVTRSIEVHDGASAVLNVNELELIGGELWANVWTTDRVLRIDPNTGAVSSIIDLTGLRPTATLAHPDSVLNGIAYDPAKKRVFVTGKNWDRLFEIRVSA